jgi:hypothetical protein
MSRLVKAEDPNYLLVKRNEKVIANYPIDKLLELLSKFKDEDMCSTSEFRDYDSLEEFIYNIYFLDFFEYFLDDLHVFVPDLITYEKYKTNSTMVFCKNPYFKDIIKMCRNYVFHYIDINTLYTQLQNMILLINKSTYSVTTKNSLLRLYDGLTYFTLSVIKNNTNDLMKLLETIRKNIKYNNIKKQFYFNKKTIEEIENFTKKTMIEIKKDLLSKFRLFQRKYLSAIAKLRRIGPPNALPKNSREIKKELNKNKNVDYKAYEVFCLYVLSKEENEAIYDYLAGIHKNTFKGVIYKNINNNKVANIKANTKKTHHKEYIEKSEEILEIVEDKIKEHGDIIDKETKSQVEKIRKLFDSKQFKNTLNFGNDNALSIGGKIIKDCKTIRIINKNIDKMIKEHMNKEQMNKEQEKREEVLKLLDNIKQNTSLKNNANTREKIVHLLGYNLLRKTNKLSKKESNTINQIKTKLNKILPKQKL